MRDLVTSERRDELLEEVVLGLLLSGGFHCLDDVAEQVERVVQEQVASGLAVKAVGVFGGREEASDE